VTEDAGGKQGLEGLPSVEVAGMSALDGLEGIGAKEDDVEVLAHLGLDRSVPKSRTFAFEVGMS
jgi:hypothetical protein